MVTAAAAAHANARSSATSLPSMQAEPLRSPTSKQLSKAYTQHLTTSPQQAAHGLDSSSAHLPALPPPGARPPTMIRRASRFDPMEGMPEEESHGELGPRHPLRRIREDPRAVPSPSSSGREQERGSIGGGENSSSVSLPGIKALLNAADQPPLVSPFGGSYFNPSSSHSSATSPLDSPTSRASRFSSMTSSAGAESQGGGWWAPDERSGSMSSAAPIPGRSSSYSGRSFHLEEGPDFKRRRSDLAPIPSDADETARLKWQAQSRNASFPVSSSISSSSASSLRSMLYPPPAPSSSMSRTSISHTPLASSPLSGDSPFDHHISSSRGSPLSGPGAPSTATDMSTASEASPSQTPSRPRSPTDRRPSMFPRGSISLEPLTLNDRRGSATSTSGRRTPDSSHRTRPPSPEPPTQVPRRSSLAELIKASSGDDVALANGGRFFTPSTGSKRVHPDDQLPTAWPPRRESADSIRSIASLPNSSAHAAHESSASQSSRERRNNATPTRIAQRRPVDEEDVPEPPKGSDPAMRGMEVLAESATRVADAERSDAEDKKSSQTPPASNGRGTKNGPGARAANNGGSANDSNGSAEASGSGPKYCCDYCGKSFSRPSSLRIHIYSHTGERPFVCSEPQCGRSFSVQSNLKRHAKVHEQAQQAAAHAAQNAAAQQEQAAQQMAAVHQQQQAAGGPHAPPQHVGHPHQQVFGYSVRSHPQQQHHGHPGGPQQQQHPPHMVHSHHPQHGYGPPPPPGFMPPGPGHHYHGQPHPGQQHPSHHYPPQPMYNMRTGPPPRGPPGPPHGDHRAMQHHHEMAQQRRRSHDMDAGNGRRGYPAPPAGGRRGSGAVASASEEEDELDELDEDER